MVIGVNCGHTASGPGYGAVGIINESEHTRLVGQALMSLLRSAVLVVYRFFGLPTEKQVEKIKEWLIWACIEAERALQSGTGQLKLRQVYDMFCAVPAFTWVAKLISFELFSEWVSDALVTVKEMLVSNEALATYVYGNKANFEVKKIKEQLEKAQ